MIHFVMEGQEPPDMSGRVWEAGDADPHVATAAELWPKASSIMVKQVMMAVGFHPDDASDVKWQRQTCPTSGNIISHHTLLWSL